MLLNMTPPRALGAGHGRFKFLDVGSVWPGSTRSTSTPALPVMPAILFLSIDLAAAPGSLCAVRLCRSSMIMVPFVGSEICTLRSSFAARAVDQRPEHRKPLLAPRAPLAVAADLRLVLPDDAVAVGEVLDDVGDGFSRVRRAGHRLGVEWRSAPT